jgi:hypothetical protein
MQIIPSDETRTAIQKRQPWWLVLIWVTIGLFFDWRCSYEWFAGKYSPYSYTVADRTVLIAVFCLAVSFLMVCAVRKAKLRDAGLAFFLVSILVWGNLGIWWSAHR